MRAAICGFVAGAACLQQQAALPAAPTMAAGCAIAALLLLLRGAWRLPLAGALLGFCWAALVAHAALRHPLAAQDEGAELVVTGVVVSLPYRFDDGVRFNFQVEQASGARAAVPPTITLAWYSGYRGRREAVGDVQPGERWQLAVRLQRPHGNANPYGFDYEVWLLEQGVRATGYVRADAGLNRRLDAFVASPGTLVERSRAALRARILDTLPGKPYAGVIVALVVGDQRAIDHVSLHLSR